MMKSATTAAKCFALTLTLIGCTHQQRPLAHDQKDSEDAEQLMALSKLSDEERFAIGVTSTDEGWAVAWSTDSSADADAIQGALRSKGLSALGSCGRGHCGWYVSPDEFFVAQRALLDSRSVRERGIKVVEPRLPSGNRKEAQQAVAPNGP
jgi:hypothetical protein